MNVFNCTFASAAPSAFLLYAVILCAVCLTLLFSWAADSSLRGKTVSNTKLLALVGLCVGACAVAGPVLVSLAATGHVPVRACLPNPLAALWVTVLGVVVFPAVVALRHVYRQRKERRTAPLFPYAMGNFSGTRTGRTTSNPIIQLSAPSR